MDSVLQSKRVRRQGDKIQEFDQSGANSSFKEDESSVNEEDTTNSSFRVMPAYSDNVTTISGMYSSRVSRHKQPAARRKKPPSTGVPTRPILPTRPGVPTRPTPPTSAMFRYNVFEESSSCPSLKELPHPKELFGKRLGCRPSKKKEPISSVDNHISQLRTKRAKMEEEIEQFKAAKNTSLDSSVYKSREKTSRLDMSEFYSMPDFPSYQDQMYTQKAKRRFHPYMSSSRPPRITEE